LMNICRNSPPPYLKFVVVLSLYTTLRDLWLALSTFTVRHWD
jgi:hypothetical protein